MAPRKSATSTGRRSAQRSTTQAAGASSPTKRSQNNDLTPGQRRSALSIFKSSANMLGLDVTHLIGDAGTTGRGGSKATS